MCIGHVNLIPPRTMNGVVPAREGDATLLNGPKAHGNELFGKKRDTHTHTQRVYFKGVALTLSLIALCFVSARRPLARCVSEARLCARECCRTG